MTSARVFGQVNKERGYKYILIFTQDVSNKSVELIEAALARAQLNFDLREHYKILKWNVSNLYVENDFLILKSHSNLISIRSRIPISDIALVIKRTWSPIRERALHICQILEKRNITILNGCEFIKWSHSKIDQYETLKFNNILPQTICFDRQFISNKSDEIIIDATFKKIENNLFFPMIFKTNKGSRATGVYLIESEYSLKELIKNHLTELKNNKMSEFKDGFLLQEFIATHPNPSISNYYRINIVDGKAQSVVQFQLRWEKVKDFSYKKLVDFKEAMDKPVDLNFFNKNAIEKILYLCPCKNGVIGVDIVCDADNKIYLLEFNDGPIISAIVELAEKNNSDSHEAVKKCLEFPGSLAKLCFDKIKLIEDATSTNQQTFLHSRL